MKALLRALGVAALAALGVALVAGTAVLYFGLYNVAGTEPHWGATVWVLDKAMRSSARIRATSLAVPALEDTARIASGADLYRQHCEPCHGGPGLAPQPFALGMVPLPANLAYTAREWPPQQLFWVVKHGIKMTGMPSWSFRLSDAQIWAIVAFLPAMARMTPGEYRALPPAASAAAAPTAPPRAPDARRGWLAIQQYACPTCHLIPGIATANAPVGPPLTGMAQRAFIAGVLPNTFENMTHWIRAPQQVAPHSAMPALGVSTQDAADIAAYLATLD